MGSCCEFVVIACRHEQADAHDLQDFELAILQRGAQAPWLADDVVRPRDELGCHGKCGQPQTCNDAVIQTCLSMKVLPAPCTQRRPGRDLTETMSAPTPDGAIRIGLGHGAIMDFAEGEGSAGIIRPDRAQLSGLDYLGLGDWHGRMQIGPVTWYSGTPEADGFKHDTAPGALAVNIAASGAPAQVSMVPTGHFTWLRPVLDLLPGEDTAARLSEILPPETGRRDTLVRIEAAGRLTLAERAGFEAQLAAIAPDFGWFDTDLASLSTEVKADDLDLIDRGGALRRAADALLSEAADPALAQADRDLAEQALARLYALVQEVDA